jgi:hypothetical protein
MLNDKIQASRAPRFQTSELLQRQSWTQNFLWDYCKIAAEKAKKLQMDILKLPITLAN